MKETLKKIMQEIEQQPWQYLGEGYYYFVPTDKLYVRKNGVLSMVDWRDLKPTLVKDKNYNLESLSVTNCSEISAHEQFLNTITKSNNLTI